jgi:hypothetical protein
LNTLSNSNTEETVFNGISSFPFYTRGKNMGWQRHNAMRQMNLHVGLCCSRLANLRL